MELNEPSVFGLTNESQADVIFSATRCDNIEGVEVKRTYSVIRDHGRVRCIETSANA